MSPPKTTTLLFSVSLIFLLSEVVSSTELYETVCRDAGRDNDRCLKILRSDTQITSSKNYPTLCKFILMNFIGQARKGRKELQDLVKKYPSSKAIKECAREDYNNMVSSFESALDGLDSDGQATYFDASVAGDGPNTCARALADEKIVNDPFISTLNNDMFFLSTVACLAINHLPDE